MSKHAVAPEARPDGTTSGFGQRSKPPLPHPALQENVPPAPEAPRTVASEVRKIFRALVVLR